jgi:hypothetical protein
MAGGTAAAAGAGTAAAGAGAGTAAAGTAAAGGGLTLAQGLGLGLSAASAGLSFIQAAQEREKLVEAENEAAKAFEEAQRKLQEQYFSSIGIPTEVYRLEREAIAQAGAQAIEAGREGEARGAGAVAGRVVAAQQDALAKQRADMEASQREIDILKAQELAKLQQQGVDLALGQVEGMQALQADIRARRAQANLAAVGGMFDIAGSLVEQRGLYPQQEMGQGFRSYQRQQNPSGFTRTLGMSNIQPVLAQGLSAQPLYQPLPMSSLQPSTMEEIQAGSLLMQ